MKFRLPLLFKGKRPQLLMWLGLISVSLFGYNNCSNDVEFSTSSFKPGPFNYDLDIPGTPPRLDQIIRDCSNPNLPHQSLRKNIEFIEPSNIVGINTNNLCGFNPVGLNDNLSELNGYFRARLDQVQNFPLPANAVLCGLSFGSSAAQNMFYDDEMILSFDNIVISSTFDLKDGNSRDVFYNIPSLNLFVYSWNPFEGATGLKGQLWSNAADDSYCLGAGSTCAWPQTQTLGAVQLNFDSRVFKSITALAATPNPNHEFKLTTTGDDNPIKTLRGGAVDSYDCYHSAIAFEVTADYVTK
ncbi:MAG: hypothetical protein SGJ18_12825 [Pseudomonadota bacterium]|nr:hypothetical protein [Pseudomonadota bacterium]